MKITKAQLKVAFGKATLAELQLHGKILPTPIAVLEFKEMLCLYLEQDEPNNLQRAANEKGEIQATEGEILISFVFGMEFSMRIVRNCGETYFNGKKPDELMLEGIVAMLRLAQVQIGSNRMELPEFSEEELEEVRRIS